MSRSLVYRPKFSRDFWICALLFGAAVIVRVVLARMLVFPQLDDPAGYIQLARNIATGRGLVTDVIWNYWVPFNSTTHPSNEFWMPLPSVLMAGSIHLLGDTLFAAQLPGILCGALLPVLTYLIGRYLWPDQRRWSVMAAALLVPGAVLVYQSVSADSSALYAGLSTLALLTAALAIEGRSVRYAGLSGLLCGVSYLTRSHGSLLPLAIWITGLIVLRHERRSLLMKTTAAGAIGYFILAVPWWLRNLSVFDTIQPIPLLTIAASPEYGDWFDYTNSPTLSSLFALGWQKVLGLRLDALIKDLSVILTVTFPFGFVGLPVVLFRREQIFRLFTVYSAILFLGVSLILSSSGPGGALYHSAGSFAPWAALGSIVVIKRLFERPATARLGVIAYAVMLGLGIGQLMLTWPTAIALSQVEGQQFSSAAEWVRQNVPPGQPVLTTQANSLNYVSGYPTLSVPVQQGADILRQVAHRYGVRIVIITEKHGLYPDALNSPTAGFRLIAALPGTLIYELIP